MQPIKPLTGTGNYSATSNNMKLVHWPLRGGLLDLHSGLGKAGQSDVKAVLAWVGTPLHFLQLTWLDALSAAVRYISSVKAYVPRYADTTAAVVN